MDSRQSSRRTGPTHRGSRLVVAGLTAAALVVGGGQAPALGTGASRGPAGAVAARGLGESPLAEQDIDTRGTALPSATQRTAARALGADVRWNDFGTPASLLPDSGSLGSTGGKKAPAAARAWLRSHHAVFGLSAAEVDGLDLVNNQRFARSDARAVLFRQRYGDLPAALDGMVTVGVADGRIAYVSSSLVKGTSAAPAATLSPQAGWLAAAQSVHADVTLSDIDVQDVVDGWTRMHVTGFAQEQQARVRALALADGTVRPVVEANVVNVSDDAGTSAYTVLVDARNGDVLHRRSQVLQQNDTSAFQGAVTASDCGPDHHFDITDDNTRQITATAAAVVTSNDLVVKILDPSDQILASGDTGTSPETATYSSGTDPLPQGTYSVRVCPFDDPTAPFVPPGNYVGSVTLSETGGTTPGLPYPPKWRYFLANPTPRFSATQTPTNSVVGCWVTRADGQKVPGCSKPPGALRNLGSRGPWDVNPNTGLPSSTTIGNNANTHEAWVSPLTPGGLFQAPVSPTREYTKPFEDRWNNSRCNPAELTPGGNDIEASVTNLFVSHNRMHDFAYFLGFTEDNYNLQEDNFGAGGQGGDPEVGNVQAGALSGGQPTFEGRDNANQIALQDGIPGITNQYLFQPIAGAFYAPCTDGGLDMGIVGHEYTHAISNRMIGGPDEGITSEQGGAMGESWGDLVAGEYQFSHGYDNGGNPWAVGLYATGNKRTAIRDYAINHNPLTYGEYGFDSTGNEVHADGEIWNATQWRVRQALVHKYDARFPYSNKSLQRRCADGGPTSSPLPVGQCPGNRRWLQLMFDAFLLQQGGTSMLDARDAMIAADRMRFGGANRTVLWKAFARSGMGVGASTPNADSGNVKPSFAAKSGNRSVTFRPVLPNGRRVAGRIYIGTYQARATAVADTIGATKLDATVRMAPGTYPAVVRSGATGLERFTLEVGRGGGALTRVIPVRRNLAGSDNGAKVIGSSAGSINQPFLIDASEATNWAGINDGQNVDELHPYVVVDLAGGKATRIGRVVVSAMLRPAPASPTDVPLAQEDPDSGSRFTALRKFRIDVCVRHCGSDSAVWKKAYTSRSNAFPSVRPRPTAPTLAFREFGFAPVKARAVRIVALENQCTGFSGYAGEQDDDPTNTTDCKAGSDRGQSVRVAELEVFDR